MELLLIPVILFAVITAVITSISAAKKNADDRQRKDSPPKAVRNPEFPPGAAEFAQRGEKQDIAPRVGVRSGISAAPVYGTNSAGVSQCTNGISGGEGTPGSNGIGAGVYASFKQEETNTNRPAVNLFEKKDDIVKAVIYSEIMRPKFRR